MNLINAPENFEKISSTETRVRIIGRDLVQGKDYDRIDATYPTNTQEVFTYSLAATTVQVVTVNYDTPSKANISSVVYS
jgi:hypothetical protein